MFSVAIHKSAVHFFKRYKREHALQFIFEEEAFTNLDWKIPGKEFTWNGDMYDVIRLESRDCKKVVICFKDVLEAKLLRLLRNTSRDLSQGFSKFISHIQLYFEEVPDFIIQTASVQFMGLPEPKSPHSIDFYEYLSPPPEA